ncbi:MAG TPA: NAD-dependent epimerase/dehydratase family protein [Rhizobiales bacterium]|nr:NAD-dependent epimerase/dehydratase family protein [Hyphomicrobiales bacterium]
MKIFLTGAAGFIGYHAARRFLERGDTVLGVDNLSDYYSVELKKARLERLAAFDRFRFVAADVAEPAQLSGAAGAEGFDAIVHLAAQAGVRFSLENPFTYVQTNVAGQVAIFDLAVRSGRIPIVYASSSSVYGANEKIPFAEDDRVDRPVSVYAATKRAGELLAHAYRETCGIASTGLRFFTVYGRYGRPDMAPWLFTDAVLKGDPIQVFNNGEMERDFTHVSDIVAGVVAAADRILAQPDATEAIYNLGNNRPVRLLDFIAAIERATGRAARLEMRPKPAGDVVRTFADISRAARDLGFRPAVALDEGIADFVAWFRAWNGPGKASAGA